MAEGPSGVSPNSLIPRDNASRRRTSSLRHASRAERYSEASRTRKTFSPFDPKFIFRTNVPEDARPHCLKDRLVIRK
ncbi:MAG TPA: hypothetical protein IAB87_06380 [Candidatus Coprenecus merdipullorum]|nr:hypothetical protein [Candidatus Coprenecus merdipullorum]